MCLVFTCMPGESNCVIKVFAVVFKQCFSSANQLPLFLDFFSCAAGKNSGNSKVTDVCCRVDPIGQEGRYSGSQACHPLYTGHQRNKGCPHRHLFLEAR